MVLQSIFCYFWILTRLLDSHLEVVLHVLHKSLGVQQPERLYYSNAFHQVKQTTVLELEQEGERDQRNQVEGHLGLEVSPGYLGQVADWQVTVLSVIFCEELQNEVQKVDALY